VPHTQEAEVTSVPVPHTQEAEAIPWRQHVTRLWL
jgi:hypothetical protein